MTNINTATLTASGTATLTPRWNCVAVTNDNATAVVYVTTNNTAPNAGAPVDGQVTIPAGATMVLANQLRVWNQSATVLQNNLGFESISTAGMTNPGTIVQVTGVVTSVTVAGCG